MKNFFEMPAKEDRNFVFTIIGGLVIAIILLCNIPAPYFTLQYFEDGELKTEVYRSTQDFNKGAQALKAKNIKYWRYRD